MNGQASAKKVGRPKKKPDYDKQKVNKELIEKAVKLFEEPYDDRVPRSDAAPTLFSVAKEMSTTTIRARKMLVTAGVYTTEASRRVQGLAEAGCDITEIMKRTQLGKSSVYSYLPYGKGLYNLDDPTLCAEQNRQFRARNLAVEELKQHLNDSEAEMYLWKAIKVFEGYPFETCRGIPMRYEVYEDALHFNWKDKRFSKACVMATFHRAR